MTNFLRPNLDPHALARELSGKHLIGGAMVPAASGKTFEVINPAIGEVIGQGGMGWMSGIECTDGNDGSILALVVGLHVSASVWTLQTSSRCNGLPAEVIEL